MILCLISVLTGIFVFLYFQPHCPNNRIHLHISYYFKYNLFFFLHCQFFQCIFFSFQYCIHLININSKHHWKTLRWWLVSQHQFLFSNVPTFLSCQLVSINAQSPHHVHRSYLVMQWGYSHHRSWLTNSCVFLATCCIYTHYEITYT